jgi:hypothetical protein
MAQMASRRRAPDHKDEVLRFVNSFGSELSQPEDIKPDELYEILVISAPLFDQQGDAAFNLSLIGFSDSLSGKTISSLADQLVRTCLDVTRSDRADPSKNAQDVHRGAAEAPTQRVSHSGTPR